jgi:predicted GNAT family acetyltransferase
LGRVNARDRALGERIAEGIVEAWRDRVRHLVGHVIEEVDGIVVCLSNLPARDQQAALVRDEPRDAMRALADAEAIFRANGQSFGILVQRQRHGSVDRALREYGLTVVMTEPAMAIGVGDVSPAVVPAGVEIVRVTAAELLGRLVDVEVRTFGSDPIVAERMLGPGQLELPAVRFYAALLDGRPVAQAYTHTVNGATSAWGVATVPELRGRGIGTAITAFAIRDAPSADLAWLMATREGRSTYERMGFRHASDWDVWAHA